MSRNEVKSEVDLWFYFGFRLLHMATAAVLAFGSFGRDFEHSLIMAGIAMVILGQCTRKWEDSL